MRCTFDNCETLCQRDQSFWNNFLNAFRPVSSKEVNYCGVVWKHLVIYLYYAFTFTMTKQNASTF